MLIELKISKMEVVEKISLNEQYVKHLKAIKRSWLWFRDEIEMKAVAQKKDDMVIGYSKLYYTLKGAYEISNEQRDFWNSILGVNFN